MKKLNIFLSSDFVQSLPDTTYEAIYLLVRTLSSLRLSQKVFMNAILSGKYRNFEIIELNSNLISTYLEAAKAYSKKISNEIFKLRGIQPDNYTRDLIEIFSTQKNKTSLEYQVLLFLRDNVTFHFHGEYINNVKDKNDRITFMGFIDPTNNEAILTNTVPHIIEMIQKITNKKYEEDSIISLFKELNTNIIYPFIEYIDKLTHDTIDDFLIIEQ